MGIVIVNIRLIIIVSIINGFSRIHMASSVLIVIIVSDSVLI